MTCSLSGFSWLRVTAKCVAYPRTVAYSPGVIAIVQLHDPSPHSQRNELPSAASAVSSFCSRQRARFSDSPSRQLRIEEAPGAAAREGWISNRQSTRVTCRMRSTLGLPVISISFRRSRSSRSCALSRTCRPLRSMKSQRPRSTATGPPAWSHTARSGSSSAGAEARSSSPVTATTGTPLSSCSVATTKVALGGVAPRTQGVGCGSMDPSSGHRGDAGRGLRPTVLRPDAEVGWDARTVNLGSELHPG